MATWMTPAALDASTPGTSPLPPWQHTVLCFQSWPETSTCNSVLLARPSSTHRNSQTCFSMSSRRPRHPPCCPILASSWAAFLTPPNPHVFHGMGCLSKAKEIRCSRAPLPKHLYPSALTNTTHRPESCTRAIACKHWIWSTAIPGCPPRLGPQHSSGSPICFPGLHFLYCKQPFHTSDPLPQAATEASNLPPLWYEFLPLPAWMVPSPVLSLQPSQRKGVCTSFPSPMLLLVFLTPVPTWETARK